MISMILLVSVKFPGAVHLILEIPWPDHYDLDTASRNPTSLLYCLKSMDRVSQPEKA